MPYWCLNDCVELAHVTYTCTYEPTNALDFNSETLKCWNMEKVDPEMLQLLVLPKWWSFVGHFPAFEGHFSQMTHKCFDKWPRNVYQKFKFESRISPTSPLNLMKARILPYKAYPNFFLKCATPPSSSTFWVN